MNDARADAGRLEPDESPTTHSESGVGKPLRQEMPSFHNRPIWAELGDLAWLQGRLLVGAFKRGEQRDQGRLIMLLLLLVGMLPSVSAISIGLVIALKQMPIESLMPYLKAGFTFLLVAWAASPVAGQQIFEGLHLARLGHLPISESGRSWGSVLSGMAGLVGIASLPVLLAAAVGGAHGIGSTIALFVSMLLFLLALALTRAIAAATYELLADDRQMRNLVGLLTMAAFLSIYISQLGISNIGSEEIMPFSNTDGLAVAFATYLPSGFFADAIHSVATESLGGWLSSSALLLFYIGVSFGLHPHLQRRLFLGEPLPARAYFALLGAPITWAGRLIPRKWRSDVEPAATVKHPIRVLYDANLINARRSVVLSRIVFMPIIFSIIAFYLPKNQPMPVLAFGLFMGGVSAFLTAALLSNSFGLIDHVGVSRLFLSPISRRSIILAHDLTALSLLLVLLLPPALAGSLGASDLRVVPAALLGALLIQLPLGGIALFNSVRFPVYMDPERGQADANQGAFAAVITLMLGGAILAAPPAAFVAYELVFAAGFPLNVQSDWPIRSLGLGLVYGIMVHGALVLFAAKLLPKREAFIIEEMDRNG